MSIIEKLVLLGKLTKAVEEVNSVDYNGVYLSAKNFSNIFGTDNSNFELENWGGIDDMRFCTKMIRIDGVKIWAIFDKSDPDYFAVPRADKIEFEAAAAKLATALEVD